MPAATKQKIKKNSKAGKNSEKKIDKKKKKKSESPALKLLPTKKIVKGKTKRILENRQPKLVENVKGAIFLKGPNSSDLISQVMSELVSPIHHWPSFFSSKNEHLGNVKKT